MRVKEGVYIVIIVAPVDGRVLREREGGVEGGER